MYEDGDVTEYERFARLRAGFERCLQEAALHYQMADAAEASGDRKLARELRCKAREWEKEADSYERSM